jgi:hypothetical protein
MATSKKTQKKPQEPVVINNDNQELSETTIVGEENPSANPSSKALIGNSRVWNTMKNASDSKYFERYFYINEGEELGVGTKLFNDAELSIGFEGLFGWITISSTTGENNPEWNAARIDESGEILELVRL